MVQLIGLIIAAYALVRLVQVVFELSDGYGPWKGIPFLVRFICVCAMSALGIMVIGVLAMMLLATPSARNANGF